MPLLRLSPPRLVTFDAFGTIYIPRPSVPVQYSNAYAAYFPSDPVIDPALIDDSFKKAFKLRSATHPNYAGGEHHWWHAVIRHTFYLAGAPAFQVKSETGSNSSIHAEFVFSLFNKFNTGAAYTVYSDIPPFLNYLFELSQSALKNERLAENIQEPAAIKTPKTKIGIITNSDGRVRSVLSDLGVVERWMISPASDVIVSSEIGHEKPSPIIFQKAIELLVSFPADAKRDPKITEGVDNSGSEKSSSTDPLQLVRDVKYWHVGDEYKKDIAPIVIHGNVAGELRGWGAIYICRDLDGKESSEKESGSRVKLLENGRVIIARDLKDLISLWGPLPGNRNVNNEVDDNGIMIEVVSSI
ncbi:hypothetical protein V1511DRAFT_459693 [Dipodascopsis uninucleata]